jgi:DNA-binding Lrp family transcriptional regulator
LSEVAIQYVQALAKGKVPAPDGKPMSSAELRVLKALAALHNEYVWCAWAKTNSLAKMTDMSQSHCRRQIERMVRRGILRRYFVVNEGHWQEQAANDYEFVALGVKEVSQQERDTVMKYRRVRSAIQLSLRRGGRQRKGAGSTSGEQGAEGSNESVQEMQDAVAYVEPDELEFSDVALDDVAGDNLASAVQMCVDEVVGRNHQGCEGQPLRLPIELLDSLSNELPHPQRFPEAPRAVEKLPIMTEAKATARAKATATTSSTEAAWVSMKRAGEAGMSSRRGRGEAELGGGGVERGLEGFDEPVRQAVRWVLGECDVAPETATRTLRKAVGEALLLGMERKGFDLAAAAERMVASWREYMEFSWALYRKLELRRFAGEGLWLDQNRWDWDKTAIRERRGR